MKPYLEFMELTDFSISLFIEEAAHQKELPPVFLLGKAAGYVDMAYALDRITELQAIELHACIGVYTGIVTRPDAADPRSCLKVHHSPSSPPRGKDAGSI